MRGYCQTMHHLDYASSRSSAVRAISYDPLTSKTPDIPGSGHVPASSEQMEDLHGLIMYSMAWRVVGLQMQTFA